MASQYGSRDSDAPHREGRLVGKVAATWDGRSKRQRMNRLTAMLTALLIAVLGCGAFIYSQPYRDSDVLGRAFAAGNGKAMVPYLDFERIRSESAAAATIEDARDEEKYSGYERIADHEINERNERVSAAIWTPTQFPRALKMMRESHMYVYSRAELRSFRFKKYYTGLSSFEVVATNDGNDKHALIFSFCREGWLWKLCSLPSNPSM